MTVRFQLPKALPLALSIAGLLVLSACSGANRTPLSSHPNTFNGLFRQSVSQPPTAANRKSEEVSLGLRLFFEPRLSANNALSCASCHQPGKGFSNGEPNAAGVTGARGRRNVPTIYGLEKYKSFFWDGRANSLEEQALGPIQNPIEMNETLPNALRKLSAMPYYQQKFQQVYGTPPTADNLARAIASFERAIQLQPSRYDRYLEGDFEALSPQEANGLGVFGRQAHCSTCHKGTAFTDNKFHNIGVGFDRPNPDPGRQAISNSPEDYGAFRTPALKQMNLTGPFMHDGSQRTLEEVVDYYDRGGNPNPNLSNEMNPIGLTPKARAELIAFLKALQAPGDNLRELAQAPGVTLPGEAPPPLLQAVRIAR